MRRTPALLAAIALSACNPTGHGTQIGVEDTGTSGSCRSHGRDIGMDEENELGFTPRELVESVGGPHQTPITWDGGTVSTLTLSLHVRGENADLTVVTGDEADHCRDSHVWIPITAKFSTADGLFSESLDGKLSNWYTEGLSWIASVEVAALQGTYTASSGPQHEPPDVQFFGSFPDGIATGSVAIYANSAADGVPMADLDGADW